MNICDYIDTDIIQEKASMLTIDDIFLIASGSFKSYKDYVVYVNNYNSIAQLKNKEQFEKIGAKYVVKGRVWVYRNILHENLFNYIIQKGALK